MDFDGMFTSSIYVVLLPLFLTHSYPVPSSVSIVDFEQVIVSWKGFCHMHTCSEPTIKTTEQPLWFWTPRITTGIVIMFLFWLWISIGTLNNWVRLCIQNCMRKLGQTPNMELFAKIAYDFQLFVIFIKSSILDHSPIQLVSDPEIPVWVPKLKSPNQSKANTRKRQPFT